MGAINLTKVEMFQTVARKQDLLDLLLHVSVFEQLDAAALHQLTEIASHHRFHAGTVILNQGEQTPCMYLVATGTAKVSRLSRSGREHILNLLRKGDLFNDVTILDEEPSPATVVAHTDCCIWYFPGELLIASTARHPGLTLAIARNVSKYSRYLVQEVDGLSMCSVKARLARFLLNQSSSHGSVHLQMTQEELASHLGTVREMIGRTLSSMRQDGIIHCQSQVIRILDRERLIRYAEL